jgi:hypothetical protein
MYTKENTEVVEKRDQAKGMEGRQYEVKTL